MLVCATLQLNSLGVNTYNKNPLPWRNEPPCPSHCQPFHHTNNHSRIPRLLRQGRRRALSHRQTQAEKKRGSFSETNPTVILDFQQTQLLQEMGENEDIVKLKDASFIYTSSTQVVSHLPGCPPPPPGCPLYVHPGVECSP